MDTNVSHLTVNEISSIQKQAIEQQELRKPNFIALGIAHTSILKLSQQNGLILIRGNKDTGFEHIRIRHEYFSQVPFWKENDGQVYLDSPTRLSPNSVPIMDYVKIADSLYLPKNINLKGCKHPDLYDMYSGEIEYKGGNHFFNLLLYKETKIIHTLYPKNTIEKKEKPKNFHFFRGTVTGQHDLTRNVLEMQIPYMDSQNRIAYLVKLYTDYHINIQTIVVEFTDTKGRERFAEIGKKPINIEQSLGFLILHYQVADLRDIEECIKNIDKQMKSEI